MSVVVWERDGLWEARLARELEPDVRVRAARSRADATERLGERGVLVIVPDTAAAWLDAPVEAAAVILIADDAGDPLWLSAGVSVVFAERTPADEIAACVRRILEVRPNV